jgi:hypothetical protein
MLDELTELDRRIIVALQHDGRASWRAIAEMVGGTVATVTRRGQHLLSSGVARIAVLPALGSEGPVDAFPCASTARPARSCKSPKSWSGIRMCASSRS